MPQGPAPAGSGRDEDPAREPREPARTRDWMTEEDWQGWCDWQADQNAGRDAESAAGPGQDGTDDQGITGQDGTGGRGDGAGELDPRSETGRLGRVAHQCPDAVALFV